MDETFIAKEADLTKKKYSMHSKIKGSTFRRGQDLFLTLKEGQELILEREPTNPYDAAAIKVMLGEEQLGYIPTLTAQDIAPIMDNGIKVKCTVAQITGLDKGFKGCNILLEWEL